MKDNSLLAGIVKDAQDEAERILLRAQRQVEQRGKALEGQIRGLAEESDRLLSRKGEAAQGRILSMIRTEERRIALRTREALGRRVIKEAVNRLADMVDRPEYQEILARWIAEGALGVNCSEAVVRCSFREKLTDAVLRRAEVLVLEASGKEVRLTANQGDPLADQGVVLTSTDGRISFSNQVSSRLRRYGQDVSQIIGGVLNL